MSWEPGQPAGREGLRELPLPIALGVAIGTLVQLLGFVIVTVLALASTGPGESLAGGRMVAVAGAGAGASALACALT
ncbi:MAG TPA: hypothetical protein VHN80_31785, partial [Kineosporiaceae bacterium]|nr:hypothetical protein [Kineosporiaceae bacterium]